MIGNIYPESPWEIARLGKFTSSKCDDLLTEPKLEKEKKAGELSVTAKKYVYAKASEIVTGTTRQLSNWALEWGNQYEPEAAGILKQHYPDFEYLGKESPIFFQLTDFSGGSPDGLDRIQRIVDEIKCPEDPSNHVYYCTLKTGEDLKKAERAYYNQIHMNMVCVAKELGCRYEDMSARFTSYCPIVNYPFKKMHTIEMGPEPGFYEKLLGVIGKAELLLADVVSSLKDSPSILLATPIDHGILIEQG